MKKEPVLSDEQLRKAIEIIQDFMETEGLEFWVTQIRGDAFVAKEWKDSDILVHGILEGK